MTYTTLLFDLDGTLSDPLLGFARSINHALLAFDLPARADAELAPYIGPPLEGTVADLTGCDDPVFIAAVVAKYRERYLDIGFAENALYPGVVEALSALAANGQRMAICTSKPAPTARLVLDRFELQNYFEFVCGGGLNLAKWQQIESLIGDRCIGRNSLMIGDRAVDLTAGHRNDIHAAGVLWGYGSSAELRAESPEFVFDSPAEWLALVS